MSVVPAGFLHTAPQVVALAERVLGERITAITRHEHGIVNAVYFLTTAAGRECVARVSERRYRDYAALEVWAFGQCAAIVVPVPALLSYDLHPAGFPEPYLITARVHGLLGDSAQLTMAELLAAYEDL